ncbi:MAG: RNA 2',3'-cyclic phosphodiesterase [Candidatus Omnitrophica bacterium]|nr:RNA 2',3'-cyclic phosphodiesterase [Candidatus Omnitrophota bacterium]
MTIDFLKYLFYNMIVMRNEKRTFIAVEINNETREELTRIQIALKKELSGTFSWVKPENIHLTLRFIGHINEEQINTITTIISEITKKTQSFNADLGVLGTFPSLANPLVLWVGINFGYNQLNQISAHLEEKLEQINFAAGEKYFHPHLTLCRIKKIETKNNLSNILQSIPPKPVPFQINKIVLFESTLSKDGAQYSKLFESHLQKQ